MVNAMQPVLDAIAQGYTLVGGGVTFILAQPFLLIPLGVGLAVGIVHRVKGIF